MDNRDELEAELGLSRRTKGLVAFGTAVLMIALGVFIFRTFAPNLAARAVESVMATFTVTITTPEPTPTPPPAAKPKAAGDEGAAGKKAIPRENKAPPNKLPLPKDPAPAASSTGSANTSGATSQGNGTGAGQQGSGTGAGGSGNGTGGGAVTKPVHVSGQISNAADFPVPPGGREARVGKSTILALTVSPNGRATACRVYKSSGFPETDATACVLAMQRLRFKPATNGAGQPVTGTFYWQQKYYF